MQAADTTGGAVSTRCSRRTAPTSSRTAAGGRTRRATRRTPQRRCFTGLAASRRVAAGRCSARLAVRHCQTRAREPAASEPPPKRAPRSMALGPVVATEEQPEEHALVHQALAALQARDREILLLAEWEGLSPTEIATVVGCLTVTARGRLHRAAAFARCSRSCRPASRGAFRHSR